MDHITVHDWGKHGTVTVFPNEGSVARGAARWLAQRITDTLKRQENFHLVLAGGSTPALCYRWLSQEYLDWTHVVLSLGDERCLPVGHAERNDTLVQRHLLQGDAKAAHFIRMPAELGAVQGAAAYQSRWLRLPTIDVAMLGLGEDGHTASLFPGNPALDDPHPVVAVGHAPKPPADRLSLGLSTLQQARERLFLVTGERKQAALDLLQHATSVPATAVGAAHWFVDQASLPPSLRKALAI